MYDHNFFVAGPTAPGVLAPNPAETKTEVEQKQQ
jgi:hypothetical protein